MLKVPTRSTERPQEHVEKRIIFPLTSPSFLPLLPTLLRFRHFLLFLLLLTPLLFWYSLNVSFSSYFISSPFDYSHSLCCSPFRFLHTTSGFHPSILPLLPFLIIFFFLPFVSIIFFILLYMLLLQNACRVIQYFIGVKLKQPP